MNNEVKTPNLSQFFENFMAITKEYTGKDYIKKLFYAEIHLVYLAKKNKIDLAKGHFVMDADNGTNCDDFKALAYRLIIHDKKTNNGANIELLNKIVSLFEAANLNREIQDELYEKLTGLSIKEIERICYLNSLELMNYTAREGHATSSSLVELNEECLRVQSNEKVLDMCSGSGEILVKLSRLHNINLTGIEISEADAFISQIRLAVLANSPYEIITNDALTYPFKQRFDKIFCEFPLGLRIDDFILNRMDNNMYYWRRPRLTADFVFLNRIASLLKEDGKAAIIMSDGPLFKSIDIDCRKDLLVSDIVKSIIKLPNGIIPNTNISVNLVILSKRYTNGEITFVDASKEYTENQQKVKELKVKEIMDLVNKQKINDDRVKSVKVSEILKTNDVSLMVNSYVKKKEPNLTNPQILKEYVLKKYRGYQFTAKEKAEIEDEKGKYELLTITDIEDGKISNHLLRINGSNQKYDYYLLKNDDVVISSRGTQIKVAVANVNNRKIIPTGNLLILRLDTSKLNPYYLQAYLNSENGQLSLKQIQTGAKIISINPSRIEQIKISMVDKEAQEEFAAKYQRKMTELRIAQDHVKTLKEEISSLFVNEIEKKENIQK